MSPTLFLHSLLFSYLLAIAGTHAAVITIPANPLPAPSSAEVVASPTAARVVAAASTPTAAPPTASATVAVTGPRTGVVVVNSNSTSTSSTATPLSTSVSPLGGASDVFVQGQACRASWTPAVSNSSTWKNMTISLMTGSNLQMTKLATVVAGIDGTNANVTTYNYTCPAVNPYAAIYFLQYTHDDNLDPTWTTRFAIANASGIYFPAPNANQPQGGSPAVPWGQGKLVLASLSTPASTDVTSSSSQALHAADSSSYLSVSTVSCAISALLAVAALTML